MDSEILCPNCGYQITSEDVYCPSCRHRIDFPATHAQRHVELEPISEIVQLSKALVLSSYLYLISTVLSTAEFSIQLVNTNSMPNTQSIIVMSSIGFGALSALYLGSMSLTPSRRVRSLHFPALLTLILGVANLLLVIGLASIFPFPSTLDSIVNGLASNGNVLQLVSQYGLFFTLFSVSGFLLIIGAIGLILLLLRVSRVLRQPLVYYGMLAGVVCTFLQLLSGLSVVMVIPPILIIVGARRALSSNVAKI